MQTILHTIETAGPGGAETVVFNLASALDPQKFRSVVVLPEENWLGKKLRDAGIPTYFVQSRGWYDFRIPAALARVAERERVSLIHSHLPGYNFYSCIAGRLARRKVAVTYHGPVELADATAVRSRIKLWTVRSKADVVVVVCDFVGEILRSRGFPSSKITTIPNGIATNRFSDANAGVLRQQLGIGDDIKLVGTVANVRASKGYEFYLRAARIVLDKFPKTVFVAAGDIDPVLGAPLLDLHRKLNLGDKFRFLGFREDVPHILKDLDVFVLSSTSEGLPLVTLEAMASGKPLVVTRCGGPQEVVQDGIIGHVVAPGDAAALAAAIGGLLQVPERAECFGEQGKVRAESEFSIQAMVRRYEDLYARITENN